MTLLSVAVEAAKIAGRIQLRYFQKNLRISTKSTPFDRVTIADVECEKAIVRHIKKHFPRHDLIGEEDTYPTTGSPYIWAIDPIDGTNNYSKGYPFFCVSIGLAFRGKPIVGVVYDAFHKELFTAERGKGTKLNGKKMHVSPGKNVAESILVTGFYYDRSNMMEKTLEQMWKFLNKGVLGIRRTGSAALDLAYVAAGRADGFWELKLNPWDFLAGWLLVQEAGGKVTDLRGKSLTLERGPVVATNGRIHEEVLDVIR